MCEVDGMARPIGRAPWWGCYCSIRTQAGCPSGQWEWTVNPPRELRRFESFTCHHVLKGPLTCGNAVRGPFVVSGCDRPRPAVYGCSAGILNRPRRVTHPCRGAAVLPPQHRHLPDEANRVIDRPQPAGPARQAPSLPRAAWYGPVRPRSCRPPVQQSGDQGTAAVDGLLGALGVRPSGTSTHRPHRPPDQELPGQTRTAAVPQVLSQHVGEGATGAVANHQGAFVATGLRKMRDKPFTDRDSVFDSRGKGASGARW